MWAPHQIGGLLANLRSAFDLILIDAAPALVSADTALLAPHADAALLVAEAGTSDLDALAQVATELSGVGLRRIGAVLNRFNPRRAVGYTRTAAVRHSARRDGGAARPSHPDLVMTARLRLALCRARPLCSTRAARGAARPHARRPSRP